MTVRKFPSNSWEPPRGRKKVKNYDPQTLLLTTKQAAAYTGLSLRTLYEKRPYLDHIQLSGKAGKVYFPLDSLKKFISDNIIYGKNKDKNKHDE